MRVALLPLAKAIGVSVRIEDETERARLKEILQARALETGHGYIVRTNAEGQGAEALAEDVAYLTRLWQSVQEAMARTRAGERVYEDLSLPLRALRVLLLAIAMLAESMT